MKSHIFVPLFIVIGASLFAQNASIDSIDLSGYEKNEEGEYLIPTEGITSDNANFIIYKLLPYLGKHDELKGKIIIKNAFVKLIKKINEKESSSIFYASLTIKEQSGFFSEVSIVIEITDELISKNRLRYQSYTVMDIIFKNSEKLKMSNPGEVNSTNVFRPLFLTSVIH